MIETITKEKFNSIPKWQKRDIFSRAVIRMLKDNGFEPQRVPGRGRSNIWEIKEKGQQKRVSIRTSQDRWFAFPPSEKGARWRTLDDVDIVMVATVDDRENPGNVEVYRFNAVEVRDKFAASYAARKEAGQTMWDGFGVWVNLDKDDSLPYGVGSGLAIEHQPIGIFSLKELVAEYGCELSPVQERSERDGDDGAPADELHTIAEVMDWTRKRIATMSGVRTEAIKLDCHIET